MQFYTTEKLGLTRERTPEQYLLCRNTPVARTGTQIYLADELIGSDGKPVVEPRPGSVYVHIERSPEEVFAEKTIASFQGKPFCIGHPSVDVNPSNWRNLAKGTVQNVRRGVGPQSDLLLADILVTDRDAMEAIEDGTVELSAGYECDYEQIEPGRGRQSNIIGNHIALVDEGRCGSRCAIGDSLPTMKKKTFIDKIRNAFQTKDEAALEEALKDTPTQDAEETEEEKKKREESAKTGDALAALTARVAALETKDAKRSRDEDEAEEEKKRKESEAKTDDEDPSDDEDKKKKKAEDRKTRDTAAALSEAQDVFARAEILAPGIQLPTHDAKSDAQKVRDSLCALRRRALEAAASNPQTQDAVAPLLAGRDLQKLTCDALDATFIGASEIVRRSNNDAQGKFQLSFDGNKSARDIASSISAMNAAAAAFWKRQ